jgi:xanthine dehydrogenase accessory factor
VRDVMDDVLPRYAAGERFALATVVRTWSSAPRPPGATMAVTADGATVGSVSGGCVESAVYELAQEVIATGRPVRQRYGVSDEDAFAVGLTCGGSLDVFVEPVDRASFPELLRLGEDLRAGRPVALATVTEGRAAVGAHVLVWPDEVAGSLGSPGLDQAVVADARAMLAQGSTGERRYGPDGERRAADVTVFIQSFAAPPRMLIFGAIDFAAAVARMGRFLGYRVTVCDARPVFATSRRVPDAHEVVVDWPHRYLAAQVEAGLVDDRTVVCVLTHDPKFDVPLLRVALRAPAAYIGVMGSRRTHAARVEALRAAGVSEEELARLSAPIGLDLRGRTPEETAVSIAAEIIALRWGGSGRRLRDLEGRIHGPDPDDPEGERSGDLDPRDR